MQKSNKKARKFTKPPFHQKIWQSTNSFGMQSSFFSNKNTQSNDSVTIKSNCILIDNEKEVAIYI